MTLPPPDCPDWCESTERGWTAPGGDPVKSCMRVLHAGCDIDGDPVQIEITRFAFLDEAGVDMCEPEIEVRALGRLNAATALSLADALRAASAMIRALDQTEAA